MLNKISSIIECTRIYSLPMSIMSWLVIFTFSVLKSGNILYGIIALIGICFAHMGTNVLDDYLDYKSLIKQVDFNKSEYLKNTQKTKCRYIISGCMTEKEVLKLALVYFVIAGILGLFLFLKCGYGVLYFALAGGISAILYSTLSRIRMSEIAVAVAYGPALSGGVYYVMTKTFSWDAIILGMPTMFMTLVLLYIHTVMDYEFDINENKQTLANSFDSQLDSLVILKWLLIFAYVSPIFLCIFDIADWQVLSVILTIPLVVDLYNSMSQFAIHPESVPEHKWYHFPMENLKYIKNTNAESFMVRMYQSRNLMMYFSILLSVAIVISLY